jgi:cell division protein FtsI/penicillin-binding protein 2
VLQLQTRDGKMVKSFPASPAGHASVRPQDLQVILAAMRPVVADPIGTLYLGFRGSSAQFFGKSGTAETTSGAPDVWFIGGASLDSPTVVVAAVVEEKPNGRGVLEASLQ